MDKNVSNDYYEEIIAVTTVLRNLLNEDVFDIFKFHKVMEDMGGVEVFIENQAKIIYEFKIKAGN